MGYDEELQYMDTCEKLVLLESASFEQKCTVGISNDKVYTSITAVAQWL
jgi:hypothetical protein